MKMSDALKELNEQPVIKIWPTAGTLLGLSRSGVYDMVFRNEIETIRLGRHRKVLSGPLRKKLKIG